MEPQRANHGERAALRGAVSLATPPPREGGGGSPSTSLGLPIVQTLLEARGVCSPRDAHPGQPPRTQQDRWARDKDTQPQISSLMCFQQQDRNHSPQETCVGHVSPFVGSFFSATCPLYSTLGQILHTGLSDLCQTPVTAVMKSNNCEMATLKTLLYKCVH